ncbi:hypothetical protein ACJX0J_020254, partial [Zea mays]
CFWRVADNRGQLFFDISTHIIIINSIHEREIIKNILHKHKIWGSKRCNILFMFWKKKAILLAVIIGVLLAADALLLALFGRKG